MRTERRLVWMCMMAVGGAVLSGTATRAEHLEPATSLQAMFSGSKILTRDFSDFYPRDDVWLFGRNGTLRANYTLRRTGVGNVYIQEEGSETGEWRVENDNLCIRWTSRSTDQPVTCYRIQLTEKSSTGPDRYRADPMDGGKSWRFIFARYVTWGWPIGPEANWGAPFFRPTDRDGTTGSKAR